MTWPLNGSEVGGNLVHSIKTSLLLLCKSSCSYDNYVAFKWEKQGGLYQSKVTCSCACIHKPGIEVQYCKIAYWCTWLEYFCRKAIRLLVQLGTSSDNAIFYLFPGSSHTFRNRNHLDARFSRHLCCRGQWNRRECERKEPKIRGGIPKNIYTHWVCLCD